MLARGFDGRFLGLHAPHFRPADTAFALVASLAPVAVRLMVERVVR
jgi:hypothetical protein